MRALLLTAGALVLTGGFVAAPPSPPQLLGVFPPGARAGETVELTFSGHGFDGGEKLLFSAKGFSAEQVGSATATKAQQGQPTSAVKFKLTVPKDATGTHDVRVVGKNGLSNPRAFVVGDATDVNETEPNNDVGQAQKIELETAVNGVIGAPTDVDFVTFKAKAGQNVVVYCLTTSIDSKMQADIMVSGPDGKQLASNRGYRGGDAVLDFKPPADGDYFVRVSQFAYTTGGFDHFYRLTVTTKPWVPAVFPPLIETKTAAVSSRSVAPTAAMIDASERPGAVGGNPLLAASNPLTLDNEKNGTADAAQEVKVPCDIAGRIAKKAERHWYSFKAKKGDVWTLEVFAERIGSPVDAYFVLTDEKGKVIVEQDDGADTLSPNQFYTKGDDPARYRFSVPADGTYRVMVSTREAGVQFGVRDQYVLRIAKENPDFRLAVMPLTPHIPDGGTLAKGGAAAFAVFVFRFDGFSDAIELSADDLPKGVTCPKQVVGPGQTRGTLVLVADKDAEDWEGFVTIRATSGERTHTARPFTVTWPAVGVQQNQVPNAPMIARMNRGPGMALAVRGTAPFALTPTDTKLTAKAGGKVEVTLKVSRDAKYKDPIAVVAATPNFGPRPQGNNPFPPVGTAQPNSSELKVNVDVPNNLPPGTHTLVLRGQSANPPPKGGNNAPLRVVPTFAALPITVTVTK
ncbi:MAG: pre-peptidase C-terminal domain-containing protein [Planctomycetes bacterium]|nr:pre-peptidase C-terminal domain-containing protein [Planctomycetota bacterium]